MVRITVPGEGGGWFNLRPLAILTPDHQDDYWETRDALIEDKRSKLPPLVPANPAVQAPPDTREIRLTRRDLVPVFGLLMSWLLEDSSYGIDTGTLIQSAAAPSVEERLAKLTPATTAERRKLPLVAWNKLIIGLDDYINTLHGAGPKEEEDETTSPTSATTSEGTG